MIWQNWLYEVGIALGVSTIQAGILLSFIISIVLILITLIATKGKYAETVITVIGLFCVVLFTFMGWMPIWTGSIIGFILAYWIALKVSGKVGT